MRARATLTAAATGALLLALPVTALAQDVTDDPSDLDRSFVPGAGASADDSSAGSTAGATSESSDDDLPQTGGGLAALGGLALAGGAALSRRRA